MTLLITIMNASTIITTMLQTETAEAATGASPFRDSCLCREPALAPKAMPVAWTAAAAIYWILVKEFALSYHNEDL